MNLWCSDIDGVLIDSRQLVREAYKRVGVDMPLEAWGHPWKTWLPGAVGSYSLAEQVHGEKTKVYLEVLQRGAVLENALPFAKLMRALERSSQDAVYYVTGASHDAAIAILDGLDLNSSALVGSGVPTDARRQILEGIGSTGVYVDDRLEGSSPAHAAGWNFIWAKQDWHWTQ